MAPKKSSKKKPVRRASEPFWDAVIGYGRSTALDCEHCGRTHFADPGEGYEPGELEKLRNNARKKPDKYISTSEESIHYGLLDGKQTVYGCPCNAAAKYESTFWNNRRVIADYLANRSKTLSKRADDEKSLAQKVRTSLRG